MPSYPPFVTTPEDRAFYDRLKKLSPDFRCALGWHKWGDWNQDTHHISRERVHARCPMIHWPYRYKTCLRCGAVHWSQGPK